jgi:hypothetical protein
MQLILHRICFQFPLESPVQISIDPAGIKSTARKPLAGDPGEFRKKTVTLPEVNAPRASN